MESKESKYYKEVVKRIIELLDEMEEKQELMTVECFDEELKKIYKEFFGEK
ncbi:MAG: hypothetical protein J6B45_06155 [Clostridia bacterium]|nr:hypothetical protein [Clostridia bacterium]